MLLKLSLYDSTAQTSPFEYSLVNLRHEFVGHIPPDATLELFDDGLSASPFLKDDFARD